MKSKLDQVTIRQAESAEDLERLFEFRYRIYVEEMARLQRYADHERRRIEEPLDATGTNFVALAEGEVVGCIRWNGGHNTDFGEYAELYAMHLAGPFFPQHCSISTKLMVAPDYRKTILPVRLCTIAYAFAAAEGSVFDFMDCNPHLERMFTRYGYRPYRGRINHVEYGDVLPMTLVVRDHEHLNALRSPFAPIAARYDPQPEAIRHFHHHISPSNPTTTNTPITMTRTKNNPSSIITYLDGRIADIIQDIERSALWKALTAPKATPDFIRAVMREVYLEIVSYQPHVIEAAIASIGQMPRSMPMRMVKAMLRHQAEEFDHGEMALRDYVALGGSEEYARSLQISNESFAVSAVWWMITKLRDPFEYLGALYPFEGLTPIISARVKEILARKSYPGNALEYIEFHSTEDIKHANLIKALIEETVERYPHAEQSIKAGLERFLSVYPLPVWNAAYQRAIAKPVRPAAAKLELAMS